MENSQLTLECDWGNATTSLDKSRQRHREQLYQRQEAKTSATQHAEPQPAQKILLILLVSCYGPTPRLKQSKCFAYRL